MLRSACARTLWDVRTRPAPTSKRQVLEHTAGGLGVPFVRVVGEELDDVASVPMTVNDPPPHVRAVVASKPLEHLLGDEVGRRDRRAHLVGTIPRQHLQEFLGARPVVRYGAANPLMWIIGQPRQQVLPIGAGGERAANGVIDILERGLVDLVRQVKALREDHPHVGSVAASAISTAVGLGF